jgi:beta-lactamase class A
MKILIKQLLVLISFAILANVARADGYPRLADSMDPQLQKGLQQTIHKLGLSKATRKGELSLALVDITDLNQPRLAMINGDNMMYAASLPKIAILFGAFERIEHGELKLDKTTHQQLVKMIRYSSNAAATAMLNKVGKQYLADLLESPRYHLYDRKRNGGLWVGKEYAHAGAWKRDPLHHISHGATAFEVARFYYMLETAQLVSPELSKKMKAIMGKPAINHKFVRGLNQARPGSTIYRKSGTWRNYHADSAIVERDGRRYIAVALAHSNKGSYWLKRLVVAMDDLVFRSSPSTVALFN